MGILQKFRERFDLEGLKKSNDIFTSIEGHEDLKEVLNLSLLSGDPLSICICGDPGTGKTSMIKLIYENSKNAVWIDGSRTMNTSAGIREFLFVNKNKKIICVDEISRMAPQNQEILLNLLEGGTITDIKATYGHRHAKFEGLKLYASANNPEKLIDPLRSRLDMYQLPPITFEQFRRIGFKVHEDFADKDLLLSAIEGVWHILKSRDIRDLNKIMKYAVQSKADIDTLIETKLRYKVKSKRQYIREQRELEYQS